jgi:hypothetical protein
MKTNIIRKIIFFIAACVILITVLFKVWDNDRIEKTINGNNIANEILNNIENVKIDNKKEIRGLGDTTFVAYTKKYKILYSPQRFIPFEQRSFYVLYIYNIYGDGISNVAIFSKNNYDNIAKKIDSLYYYDKKNKY